MNDNVTPFVRWGGVTPRDILTQTLARCEEAQRDGAECAVVVGRVTRAKDGTKFYDISYSVIEPDAMLWLAKQIEIEAVDTDNDWEPAT